MRHHIRNITLAMTATLAAAVPASASAAEKLDGDSLTLGLSEVVVTGSNAAVGKNLLPYTVSVIGARELESSGETQLLNVLSGRVPSMFVTRRNIFGYGVSNGGSGHIKMRGVGGDRASGVLMMVDGQPQFAGIYSHHVADFYNKQHVERVEVLRGPASVLYGSNAMAGVVNVITRGAHRRGTDLSLSSQYGSYNTWQSSLNASSRYGKWNAMASVNYDRTDGTEKDFDFKEWSGYAKVGYDFSSNWKGSADFSLMNFIGNDPIYPRINNRTGVYHQNITRGAASVAVTNSYGFTEGTYRVYYSYGNHYVDDPRHFHSLDDRLGVLLYQNFTPWQGAAVTAGFDFDRYTGEIPMSGGTAHTPGAIGTIDRKAVTEYSPYVTYAQGLWGDLVTVNAGLRASISDMFHTQWVPQGGVAVNPVAGLTAKASVSMGYRNPSFRELYLYRMANPDLQPEKMLNYEVSVGWNRSPLLSIDLTAYFCKGYDMIQELNSKNMNTGRFYNKGIEVSASSRPIDNLHLWASYSYLHTTLSNLTGAPRHQYFVCAEWAPWRIVRISADVNGVSRLFVYSDVKLQSYALLNLKAEVDVCRQVSLFVRMENITDARYEINRGYKMPGFTAMGGFRLNLGF